MTRSRTDRPRPGILKVFWPAFLGWGSSVALLASWRLPSFWSETPSWLQGALSFAFGVGIYAGPVGAVAVAIRVRDARQPLPLLLNLSTLFVFVLVLIP